MRYSIKADDELLYDPSFPAYAMLDATLNREVNKAASFVFTLPQDHPIRPSLERLKTIITVWQDNLRIFRGRILNTSTDYYGNVSFTCESQLAFLNDSTVRPYQHQGTVSELFQALIEQHNSQVSAERKFVAGTVTVEDPNDYIARSSMVYPTTISELQDKLVKSLGGYLVERYENDVEYLDYLAEIDMRNLQEVGYGSNLVDLTDIVKGQDIATAIIPLGAKIGDESDERLTIKSVNDGVDYVFNQDAVNEFGWIYKTVIHDDVTLPENLMRKGREDLINTVTLVGSLSITAADLAAIDPEQQSFRFGRHARVKVSPHGIDEYMLVTKMKTDLLRPEKNKLTLGSSYTTLTEKQNTDKSNTQKEIVQIFGESKEYVQNKVSEAYQEIGTSYTNAVKEAERIVLGATETLVTQDEFGTYQSEVSTSFEQTAKDITWEFDKASSYTSQVKGDMQAQFDTISKYIRFIDGKIVLGEEGNQLTLTIANDRISFMRNNVEVAYWTEDEFYITSVEILDNMKIGNYQFRPETNGVLSFIKST